MYESDSDEFDFGHDAERAADDRSFSESESDASAVSDYQDYDENDHPNNKNATAKKSKASSSSNATAAAKKKKKNSTTASSKQEKTIEETYQKKTQLEHILLRPDTYIGSVEPLTQPMFVLDHAETEPRIRQHETTFTPGFYKIFDEIVVNAADNKQRDPGMDRMEVDVDSERGVISVMNNGKGTLLWCIFVRSR